MIWFDVMGERRRRGGESGVAWNVKRKATSNVVIPDMVFITEVALSCIIIHTEQKSVQN